MISSRFPYLLVTVRLRDQGYTEEALLDTGFEGDVAIPGHLLEGMEPDRRRRYILADGRIGIASIFYGDVQLGDLEPVPVEVTSLGDEFIIGTGILSRYEVILDHGQRVIVNP